jgi:hypothetical protein
MLHHKPPKFLTANRFAETLDIPVMVSALPVATHLFRMLGLTTYFSLLLTKRDHPVDPESSLKRHIHIQLKLVKPSTVHQAFQTMPSSHAK